MQKNFLFLYLKTGGGHLAPARSVANYLKAKHGDKVNPLLLDGFEGVSRGIKSLVEDGYRKSQASALWVFETLYALNKIPFVARLTAALLSYFIVDPLEKQILSAQPSRVVIFHFFLIRPVMAILKKHKLDIPVSVVVTDPFTAHPIWFLDKRPSFIVFSQRVKDYAVTRGILPQSLSIFPFILDEKFTRPADPLLGGIIRQNLGFDPHKRIILILGGGDGIPKGKKILKNFLRNNAGAEVAIVCGNNRELYSKALKLKEKHNFDALKVYGYVDFIYELINIADVVVTKCGASTFMEILISGKIPVINHYIWEQEKGNMEFVRDNLLGVYESNPQRLPEKISEIIYNPHIYNVYKSNIESMSLQNGTPMVSEFLIHQSPAYEPARNF